MPVEFSEYRCKRKYKSGTHKFPLFRLVILGLVLLLAYHLGFFSKVAEILPLPGSEDMSEKPSWKVACEKSSGRSFDLDNNLGQCSWYVRDSMEALPNGFLRYVASLRQGKVSVIHWVAPTDNFSRPLFVLHEDSVTHAYLHIPLADSSMVWIDESTGCRFPGLCPGPHQGPLSSVRNIKSASSLAHSASTCAFDLLTGLYIRAIHRMALIPAPLKPAIFFNELPYFTCKHDKQKTQWGLSPRAVEFYFGMFFSVALSGLKSLEIYDPGVPLTLHPRLYTVALSGLSSQASICFFESTIRSSIFRTRCPWGRGPISTF